MSQFLTALHSVNWHLSSASPETLVLPLYYNSLWCDLQCIYWTYSVFTKGSCFLIIYMKWHGSPINGFHCPSFQENQTVISRCLRQYSYNHRRAVLPQHIHLLCPFTHFLALHDCTKTKGLKENIRQPFSPIQHQFKSQHLSHKMPR